MILSDLHRDYDGSIPSPLLMPVLEGGLAAWQIRIARAAEQQFYSLILLQLEQIRFWRLRPASLKTWQSLTCAARFIANYREKACQAYLLHENAVYF